MSSSSSSTSSTSASSSSSASASTSAPATSSSDMQDVATTATVVDDSPTKRQRTAENANAAMQDVPATRSAAPAAAAPSSSSSSSSGPAGSLTQAQLAEIRVQLTRFIRQVTVGCGVAGCSNANCVTGGLKPLGRTEALAKAQALCKAQAVSCVAAPAAAATAPIPAPAASVVAAAPVVTVTPAPAATPASVPATPMRAASSSPAVVASTPAPAAASSASSFVTPLAVPRARVAPGAPLAANNNNSSSSSSASPPSAAASPAAAAAASSSASAASASPAASSSSSSSSMSPPASPRLAPTLAEMLAASLPMAPLKPREPPIEDVSEWVLQVAEAKAAWEAKGSPPGDLSFFRPLVTRIYKVFNDMAAINLSFRAKKEAEDKQAEQEKAAAAAAAAAITAAAASGSSDSMSDVDTLSLPPTAASSAAASASIASAAAAASAASPYIEADQFQPGLNYEDLEAFYSSVFDVCIVDKQGNESRPLLTSMLNGMRALFLETQPMSDRQVHPALLRAVPILLINAQLWFDPSNYEMLKMLTRFVASLPVAGKKLITSWLSDVERWTPGAPKQITAKQRQRMFSVDQLEQLLGALQQFISVRIYDKQDLNEVAPAVVCISLIHAANEEFAAWRRAIPLSVPRVAAVPVPLDFKLFYNDAVNDQVDLKADFRRWMMQLRGGSLGPADFSFSKYNFILDAGSKASLLKYDAMVQQQNQYRDSVISNGMQERAGYLILEVRRSNLIPDTMRALANKTPSDYKKPLKIHFTGEKGIDAGGLRKEFFQLIISSLFDAAYGMFLVNDETRTFRFNPDSLDSPLEFELIGVLLGIAIYNSTIMDLRMPQVIYKQLLGLKPTLDDLLVSQPALAKGLMQMLEFDGDVEATFSRDFTITYETAFGEHKVVELKPNGGSIPVTSANRAEFVDLYVSWVLEKSIAKQFGAFNKGFHRACGGEALKLFRPFELELLVCGASEFDFDALESTTRYEDGYTKDSPICKQFWEIVHGELTLDQKKKLLEFCTGSDRVPIRGLASMYLTISKQGPDSPQLPTSHTCFNHLLLPEYESKDKLRTLLLLALQNSKGFGLI